MRAGDFAFGQVQAAFRQERPAAQKGDDSMKTITTHYINGNS